MVATQPALPASEIFTPIELLWLLSPITVVVVCPVDNTFMAAKLAAVTVLLSILGEAKTVEVKMINKKNIFKNILL
jgi:hypothetical protein